MWNKKFILFVILSYIHLDQAPQKRPFSFEIKINQIEIVRKYGTTPE